MTYFRLAIQSFKHYWVSHLALMAGIIVSTMVIAGALLVGDSVTHSLTRIAELRLGNTTHSLTSGDRFFTRNLALEMGGVPVLNLEGAAISGGGKARIDKVQVLGIDTSFGALSSSQFSDSISGTGVAISKNLATRLNLNIGDFFLLRLEKASLVPRNAPFVSEEGQTTAMRVQVVAIPDKEQLGAFNLRNTQTAPFNVFIQLDELQKRVEIGDRINTALFVNGENLQEKLESAWNHEDAGLKLSVHTASGNMQIKSERVFLDPGLEEVFTGSEKILTYFVNEIKHKTFSTPYSFVSTLGSNVLEDNEIVVNRWLADDLSLKVGDEVWLSYFLVGPLRELKLDSAQFFVKRIEPMSGYFADASLTPDIPGFSDAGSCSDWDTGVPVNLEAIRDKDEKYWDDYRAAPKAFISFNTARNLWQNRFGAVTSIHYKGNEAEIDALIRKSVQPKQLGFKIEAVKENAMFAAKNGVDFGQLFMGLSFFILVSGLILTVLLLSFHIQKRESQTGTLLAMGIPQKKIKVVLFYETLFSAFIGVFAGLFVAVAYNRFVFMALNRVWNDIVRTDMLEVAIRIPTLITGMFITLFVVLLTLFFALNRGFNRSVSSQQRSINASRSNFVKYLFNGLALVLTIIPLFLFIWLVLKGNTSGTGLFFLLGILFLTGTAFSFNYFLNVLSSCKLQFSSFRHLSLKNLVRNRGRSMSVVILFSIGAFLVVSTGLNRKDMSVNASEKSSGTGGFHYFAETTLPVLKNLNNEKVRSEEGLQVDAGFVQFRKTEGDDASCLNLNRITNPAILGIEPEMLSGRFSFATAHESLDTENPWLTLDKKYPDDLVPAIADQTVIQWGLGMKVGDTLIYETESGKTLRLLLVGGLANSVFQGYVIIGNENFLNYFPSSSGWNVLLIDGMRNEQGHIAEEMTRTYRDYGILLTETGEKLAGFYSVENTYLAIFLILGVFGLILGVFGLGIVLARSVYERRSEIAVLQSLGFSRSGIIKILAGEYLVLLFAGLLSGVLAAFMATFPSVVSDGTEVGYGTLVQILLVLTLSGVAIILISALLQVKNRNTISGLRSE